MSSKGAQSIHRAIQLLKLFGTRQSEWTLAELVEESKLNKTTVFRILAALEDEGLLERTERNNYQLGTEIVALGSWAMENNSLVSIAKPALTDLVGRINERTTLEQPIQNSDGSWSMLGLLAIRSNHRITVSQVYGSRLPIHATSTGKAYLAHLPTAQQKQILEQTPIQTYTHETKTSIDALMDEFNLIQEEGCAFAFGELEDGLFAAGAPLFNHLNEPVAAISLEGPTSRVDQTRLRVLAMELKETANQISRKLGWRG